MIFIFNISYSKSENQIKIIYLSDSSLFQLDIKSKETIKLTSKDKKIVDFAISPDNKFLAYKNIYDYYDRSMPGDNDTVRTYKAPLFSIVIIEISSNTLIREIKPKGGGDYSIEKWIGKDELLISAGDIDFWGWYIYRVNDTLTWFSAYDKNHNDISSINISNDLSTKLFVDSVNQLHKYSLITKKDSIITKTNNQIIDCELSNNKKLIAWFEICQSIDKVYLLSIPANEKTQIYSEKIAPKGERKYITFSKNDSIISVEIDKSINLINLYTKSKTKIFGCNFSWVNSDTFIYSNFGCIFLYNLKLKKSQLIIRESLLAKSYNN